MGSEVIAFISGKGGTGKTTTCITSAMALASAGLDVALVDADFSTRGMTFFFDGYQGMGTSFTPGVDSGFHGTSMPIEPAGRTALDGAISLYPAPYFEDVEQAFSFSQSIEAAEFALSAIRRAREESHFVLVDCQAGVSPVLEWVMDVADHLVIVTEADPVSVKTVERLAELIRPRFTGRIWGLVSRVFEQEQHYYDALVSYLGMAFIGLLPFDRGTREAFYRRDWLVDTGRPGPYVVALTRALSRLVPDLEVEELDAAALESVADGNVDDEIAALRTARDELEVELISHVSAAVRQRINYWTGLALLVIAVALAVALGVLEIIPTSIVVLVAGVASAIGAVVGWRHRSQQRVAPERQLADTTARQLNAVEDRLAEYELAVYQTAE